MKKILQNKILVGSLMFLMLDLAGGFLILAPFLISIRNVYESSAMSFDLWPAPSASILIDILINHPQILATSAIAAFTIYLLFTLLRTYFAGGIYRIIMDGPGFIRNGDERRSGFQEFLAKTSQSWAGFVKVGVAAVAIYTVAGFLGFTVGRVFAGLGAFWMIAFIMFVMLIASTYLQILKITIVTSRDNSVINAIRGSRQILAKAAPRLVIGNLSVVVIGALICLALWLIIGSVRGSEWNAARGAITIILEQLIVLAVCLMQAVRINFNNSIVSAKDRPKKKGEQDALGGTELGGV
jgi:hypothetical protein